MIEDHKHCRTCYKAIPATTRPRFCSTQCEDIHTVLMFALIGLMFGMAAYIAVLGLAAGGG